jgi:hypothetical protein
MVAFRIAGPRNVRGAHVPGFTIQRERSRHRSIERRNNGCKLLEVKVLITAFEPDAKLNPSPLVEDIHRTFGVTFTV